MSKLVDKLQRLSKSSIPPLGFRPAAEEAKSSPMLLIARLAGVDAKEAETLAGASVDAGLILNEDVTTENVNQMVKAVGDIPLGVFLKGDSQGVSELIGAGCDFLVFDAKTAVKVLQGEKTGKFLMIEPSMDQGFVRAIDGLDIEAVFINLSGESFITVEHLLICQRFSELLDKPLIVILPSLIEREELSSLRQAGVKGIVIPLGQSPEVLAELRKMMENLPREVKRRRTKPGAVLPHYGGDLAAEEEEEEEEEI